jgi:hypothetical protein
MRVCRLKQVHALKTRPTCLEEADDATETTQQMRAIQSGLGTYNTATSSVDEPHTTRMTTGP